MAATGNTDLATVRRSSGLPGRNMSLILKTTEPSTGASTAAPCNRVIINVGGIRYETYRSTLKNIPDTRLSWLTETTSQNADYDCATGEYFFDRHPGVFNMILNYYRTGKLHVPIDVCGPLFEEELAFWGLDEKQIEPCCWTTYRTHRDAEETLKELEGAGFEESGDEDNDNVAERFGIYEEEGPERTCWEKWQPRFWLLLDEPYSSTGAQVFAIISLSFILLSISTFVLGTHISFRVPRNESDPISSDWTVVEKNSKSKPNQALEILDLICIIFFTCEYILRLIFCPSKKEFFTSILNWVDLFSILPYYIEKAIVWANSGLEYSMLLQIFKAIRLIRIFRIFKLTRHFSGLKILGHTLRASAKELLLLIMFLVISVLIFACLVYYAEQIDEHELNYFSDIPVGFWWAVVTMTTLGYGDMYPRTGVGYIVGSLCAVAGVLVLALPVPVIVNNFALYYAHAQARMKLPKKRKKILIGAPDMLKTQVCLPGANTSDAGRSPSLTSIGSTRSLGLQESKDSSLGSTDSGIKTASGSNEPSGISVVYTDEVSDSPKKPPVTPLSNGSAPYSTTDGLPPSRKDTRGRRNSIRPLPQAPPPRRRSLLPSGYQVTDTTNIG